MDKGRDTQAPYKQRQRKIAVRGFALDGHRGRGMQNLKKKKK